ncbi:MAG TPA: glycosyltransferase family 2 protein [Edaphocola sp.]|nr:glycosyltransferase family 2 protein [Edaphocola sp.]
MLSIIIVNYFGKETLLNCVQSVVDSTKDIDYEILIIDNSKDNYTKSLICTRFQEVNWIEMEDNIGFGRANNYAFSIMKGDTALLLNPDCIAKDNVIGATYAQFSKSQDVACGIQLIFEDGTFQISGNYAMKGGLNYLLPLPYIGSLLKFTGDLVKIKKPHFEPDGKSIVEVDWIAGAFLMVKKQYIDITKGFDEDFFLYAEEAEWCSRLKQLGSIVIYNNFKIIHLLGALSTEAFGGDSNSYYTLYDKKGFQIMLSNLVRIRKEFGLFWFLFIFLIYNLAIPVYAILGFVHSVFTWKNKLSNFIGFSKNIIKLWSYFSLIIANKPYFYKVL